MKSKRKRKTLSKKGSVTVTNKIGLKSIYHWKSHLTRQGLRRVGRRFHNTKLHIHELTVPKTI